MSTPAPKHTLLIYRLVSTTRRMTFDIEWQSPGVTYTGEDDGPYFKFVASNGYEVISRSRMDIQTERLWLLGAKHEQESRSGSMVFSSNEKRDAAAVLFTQAIDEWACANGGVARLDHPEVRKPEFSAWLPIESAPRDGTAVLVHPGLYDGRSTSIAQWCSDEYARKPQPYWRRDDAMRSVTISRSHQPTHWAPMPPPPESAHAPALIGENESEQ